MAKTYTYAIFDDADRALAAIDALTEAFRTKRIDILVQDDDSDTPPQEVSFRLTTGVGVGVAIGAPIGAVMMAIFAVATNVFSGETILQVFAGAMSGLFAGGIAGAIAGLGYWSRDPQLPSFVGDGESILVGISTRPDEIQRVEDIFAQVGPRDIGVLADKASRSELRLRASEHIH